MTFLVAKHFQEAGHMVSHKPHTYENSFTLALNFSLKKYQIRQTFPKHLQ